MQKTVIIAFGKIKDLRAVQLLVSFLYDYRENSDLQVLPTWITGKYEESPKQKLAAWALGEIGDKSAVPALITFLNDNNQSTQKDDNRENWDLKVTVVKALGSMGNSLAVRSLILALKGNPESVEAATAEELGRIGNPEAVEPLLSALDKTYKPFVQKIIVESLGKIGDSRAVEPLIHFLSEIRKTRYDEALEGAIIRVLGLLGDSRSIDSLTFILKSDHRKYIRAVAARALGKIGNPQSVKSLVSALNDTGVLWAAADALGRMGDPHALRPLLVFIEDNINYLNEELESVNEAAIFQPKPGSKTNFDFILKRILDAIEHIQKIFDKNSDKIAVDLLYKARILDNQVTIMYSHSQLYKEFEDRKKNYCENIRKLALQELVRRGLTV